VLYTAHAINDSGQVAASGFLNGQHRAFLVTPRPTPPANQLEFGKTRCASIAAAAQTDRYTFDGNDQDVILLRMSRASGEVWPQICLYGPNGKLVDQCVGAPNWYTPSVQLTVRLALKGTFTVLVSDGGNGTLTGDYCLYAQRLNNPGNAVPLSTGPPASAKIDHPAASDTYTFAANTGHAILIRMSRTSGEVWPQICVYDSKGDPVGSCVGAPNWFTPSVEFTMRQPVPGDYTVLVGDGGNGALLGGYNLSLTRI
jgi:hypothetical protein